MARKFPLLFSVAAAMILASTAPSAHAWAEGSVITWGTPTNISGDADVNTTGTLVAAFNMNGADVTINGVTFAAFPITAGSTTATMGNFTFTESPGQLLAESSLGSASPPFSNLSANYQTLLTSAVSTSDNNTLTLTITGLIVGQNYIFEFWTNASSYDGTGFGFRTTASAPNPVSLDDNTSNAVGGTGQYVIGTFFCGATNEIITFTGTDSTQAPTINAFELRVVPEPTTMSILLLGSATLGICRAFRRKN